MMNTATKIIAATIILSVTNMFLVCPVLASTSLHLVKTSSQYVTSTGANLTFNSSFSLSVWVNFTSHTGNQYMVFKGDAGTNVNYYLWYENANTRIFAGFRNSSNSAWKDHTYSFTPSDGTWYHIVMVFDDAANTVQLYINNVAQGSQGETDTGDISGTQTFYLGDGSDFFDGNIYQARVFNKALSSTDVGNLYSTGTPCSSVQAANTQGWWSLDSVYTDASGNGYTLTPVNSPTFTSSPTVPFSCGGSVTQSILGLVKAFWLW